MKTKLIILFLFITSGLLAQKFDDIYVKDTAVMKYLRIKPVNSLPSSPGECKLVWYNDTLRYYNGFSWVKIQTVGANILIDTITKLESRQQFQNDTSGKSGIRAGTITIIQRSIWNNKQNSISNLSDTSKYMEYPDTVCTPTKIASGQDLRDTARNIRTTLNGKQPILTNPVISPYTSSGVGGFIPHYINTTAIDSSSFYYDAIKGFVGLDNTNPTVSLEIGNSTTKGDNVIINSAPSSEMFTSFQEEAWTVTNGWNPDNDVDSKIDHTSNGITPATLKYVTSDVGYKYKIIIICDTWSVGSCTYSLGGVTGNYTINATGTYTDYITTTTTGGLIFTPSNDARLSINSISIVEQNKNGNLTTERLFVADAYRGSNIINDSVLVTKKYVADHAGTVDTTKTPLIGHLGTQWDLSKKQNTITNLGDTSKYAKMSDTLGVRPKIASGQDLRDTARNIRTTLNGKQIAGNYLARTDTGLRTKLVSRKATDSLYIHKSDSLITAPGNYVTNKKLIDSLNYRLAGKLTNKFDWDASYNVFPSVNVKNGDWWTISVKGCINGTDSLYVNTIITAKMDAPGQTVSNWNIISTGGTATIPVMLKAGSAGTGYLGYKGTTGVAGYLSKRLGTNANDSLAFTGVFNTNNLILGKTTAGGNQTIYSNPGAEMVAVPPLTGTVFTRGNWTLGATSWDATNENDVNINKNGTGVTTATLLTVVPLTADLGTTLFKIVIVCNAYTGSGQLNWTWGGVTGNFPLTSANTFTDYIIPTTTAGLIFTPSATGFRGKVNSISITRLNQNGALTVNGLLSVPNPSLTTATSDGIRLWNTTAADATYTTKYSPSLCFSGSKYYGGVAYQQCFRIYTYGNSAATPVLSFDMSLDNINWYTGQMTITGGTSAPIISTVGQFSTTKSATTTVTSSFLDNVASTTTTNVYGLGLLASTAAVTGTRVRISPSEVKRGNQWNAGGASESHYYQSFVRGITTTSNSEHPFQFSNDGGTTWYDYMAGVGTYGGTTPTVRIPNGLNIGNTTAGSAPMFMLDVTGSARVTGTNSFILGGTPTSASDYGSTISFTSPTTSFTNRVTNQNWEFIKTNGSYAGVGIYKVPTCPLDVTGKINADTLNATVILKSGSALSSYYVPWGSTGFYKGVNANGKYFRNFNIADVTDTTKLAQWNVSKITTANTRIFTFPDSSGRLALLQNLTNLPITDSSFLKYSANGIRLNNNMVAGNWFKNYIQKPNSTTDTAKYNGILWGTDIYASNKFHINSLGTDYTTFNPSVSDGSGAIAYTFKTKNNLVTSGAKIISIINNGIESYLDNAGYWVNTGFYGGGKSGSYAEYFSGFMQYYFANVKRTDINPGVSNLGTGTAYILDTKNNLTGSTKLLVVSDSGVQKLRISKDSLVFSGIASIGNLTTVGTIPILATAGGVLGIAASDRRLKENILPLQNSLNKVLKLQPVTFNYISDKTNKRIGLIYQDAVKVVPEVGYKYQAKDGKDYGGLRYDELTSVLIKAVQELNAKVDSLNLEIKKLKK